MLNKSQNILITASIVLFNNDEVMLNQVISSIFNNDLNISLILVDNSENNSLSKFTLMNPRIEYIHNPTNPGFGASHNIAIKKSISINAEFHIVINPDIYFENGTLEKLLDFMIKNEDVGHVMPKVLFPNGESQFLCKLNPTFFDLFIRGFFKQKYKSFFSERLKKYEYRNMDLDSIIFDIPYLSGCFMFLRNSVLNKNHIYFDENFFMYLEDADLTRRILQFSRTAYFPHVAIYHHYSGLTHKNFKFKIITILSAVTYFNKWGWLKSMY